MKKLGRYELIKELLNLGNEMAFAMRMANFDYVAQKKMTPAMKDIMERYYAWAKEAAREGM